MGNQRWWACSPLESSWAWLSPEVEARYAKEGSLKLESDWTSGKNHPEGQLWLIDPVRSGADLDRIHSLRSAAAPRFSGEKRVDRPLRRAAALPKIAHDLRTETFKGQTFKGQTYKRLLVGRPGRRAAIRSLHVR